MQSPPLEWTMALGYLAALDFLRSRGEADFDTLSECVRPWAQRHPVAFTAACAVVPVWFWGHIMRDRHHLTDRAIRALDRLHR
ncbi:MAG TPA: hypothetical protein VFG88_10605 [Nocardioidaceae bacterium]|nr:hypothetical protein [Nocardioidaceae bacterium]